MISNPVKELESIRGKKYKIPLQDLDGTMNLNENHALSGNLFEIELDLIIDEKNIFKIVLSNDKGEEYEIGYDGTNQQFFSNRMKAGKADFSEVFANAVHIAPRIRKDSLLKLHLYIDIASAELFADNGEVVMTDIFFPENGFSNISLKSEGKVEIQSGTIYELSSVWEEK